MINALELLIKIAREKHIDKKWTDQPLHLIKILANSSKGDLAELFIIEYGKALVEKCRKRGFDVTHRQKMASGYILRRSHS